mgnify:CR=1 FL=1
MGFYSAAANAGLEAAIRERNEAMKRKKSLRTVKFKDAPVSAQADALIAHGTAGSPHGRFVAWLTKGKGKFERGK